MEYQTITTPWATHFLLWRNQIPDQCSALQESRSINSENIRWQMISYEAIYVTIFHAMEDRFSLLGAKRAQYACAGYAIQ